MKLLSSVLLLSQIYTSRCQLSQKKQNFDDLSEFLFQNSAICGNPFADPVWVPTLDLCSISCDPHTEYCVENEDLKQMCKPLPDECQKLLRRTMKAKRKTRDKQEVKNPKNENKKGSMKENLRFHQAKLSFSSHHQFDSVQQVASEKYCNLRPFLYIF